MVPHDAPDQLFHAIGEAAVRIWSQLPHDIQHQLFEDIVTSQGEAIRPRLAVFLHDKHPRTSASLKARAMVEPDSLGG
jgi:hypothetical protein